MAKDIHAKAYNDRYSKHSRRTVSENINVWIKSILRGHTLALSSAVVYTQHMFSPREGFLTHQWSISENIKSNEYKDETTVRTRQQEITEMLKQKKIK